MAARLYFLLRNGLLNPRFIAQTWLLHLPGEAMSDHLMAWAIRHGVSHHALTELRAIFSLDAAPPSLSSQLASTEAYTQSIVRLEGARKGLKLWRNNVGVLLDERGVPVRYGLANDSKRLNEQVKSADLIGWRPVLIGPEHVGSRIAQFVSRECKRMGWRYTGNDHEKAQLRWAEAILADGGDAAFASGEGSL